MGKGIAREFKELHPDMFAAYKRICDRGALEPGKLWVWPASNHLILCFPTKKHWRNPSRLEWINAGLDKFVAVYKTLGVREISFPRLGCGNGGLDWNDVRPLMERHLSDLPIPVFIHDFTKNIGLPEHLEFVPEKLSHEELNRDDTFASFMSSLQRVVTLSDGSLVELSSKCPFDAAVTSTELVIESKVGKWLFETEELRGIWYRLRQGLVTADDAEWSKIGGGRPLLSILSLLPNVRPVEIQRGNKNSPEIAVELRPDVAGAAAAVTPVQRQVEMPWH
jgi:hypothetical protein